MKTKICYEDGMVGARKVMSAIADTCVRIEVAGSLRRKQEFVGDIELVCIPVVEVDLLGEPTGRTRLDLRLDKLMSDGRFKERTKNGDRYKQFRFQNDIQLDLFITDVASWPIVFAIRTGPADYSKQFVTPRNKGGLLQNGFTVSDRRLRDDAGNVVALTDEQHFFEFVQGGWKEPWER